MDNAWVYEIKEEFPGLKKAESWVLCDAAGGTQVHQSVISAISYELSSTTANLCQSYPSALNVVQNVARAREVAAKFFNCNSYEIVFGPNMTSLTNNIARSLGKLLTDKSNIIVTQLDHDANVSPWVLAANDKKSTVKLIKFEKSNCKLNLDELKSKVDENTKVVALGAAANSCGSITPIKTAVEIVKNASKGKALVYVDAVHYAPHGLIDVQEFGCDFLICSSYKFCGPHAAIMFGKAELLKSLDPCKLKACTELLPGFESCQESRWETGTASFEAIAGIKAAIEYLGSIGVRSKRCNSTESLRKKLQSGYDAIISHENKISETFLKEISKINGLTVYGANYVNDIQDRTPTFAINMTQHTAPQLAQELVNRGIACAAGDFYAINFPKVLGLETVEGFVRIAFFHYHTLEDVVRVLRCLKDISANYHPTTEQ